MADKVRTGTHYYFAYGSNMDQTQMAQRCPGSQMIGIATIHGYRFAIDAVGVATIIPDEAGTVYGVLWLVSERDVLRLDRYEGVAAGCYRRESISVQMQNNKDQEALVYISNRPRWSHPWGTGSPYMDNIERWARFYDFPSEYLAELHRLI